MQTNFPTDPTHGPIRGVPSTIGSRLASIMLNFFSDSGDSVSRAMSGTTPLKSRIRPAASTIPGRSVPAFPYRTSFTLVSSRNAHCVAVHSLLCKLGSVANWWLTARGAAGSIIVSTIPPDGSRSHRMMRHYRVPEVPKNTHLVRQPQRNPNVFLESRIFGSHQYSLGTQHFGRFLAAYKSSHQNKIRFGIETPQHARVRLI